MFKPKNFLSDLQGELEHNKNISARNLLPPAAVAAVAAAVAAVAAAAPPK